MLVTHSASYLPIQLAVASADPRLRGGRLSGLRTLTDTRQPEFRAIDWIEPEYVQVPSTHGAGTIRGKYYVPEQLDPGRAYPVVMFVPCARPPQDRQNVEYGQRE